MPEPINFRLDSLGEFDEVWFPSAAVHIERMSDTSFWIGIDLPDGQCVMVNTGVSRGVWFFNLEENALDGRSLTIQRPRSSAPIKTVRKTIGKESEKNRKL